MPVSSWDIQPLVDFLTDDHITGPEDYLRYRCENSPPFLFSPHQHAQFAPFFPSWDEGDSNPVAYAERIQKGELQYFEHTWVHVGRPPQWHTNPFTGQHITPDRHWSHISEFAHGDIKIIWEPSRFSFVYALVRAYWRTSDEHYAELFWRLLEHWRIQNSPQQGPNWQCGQEISLRVMAWCFGLYGFLLSSTTTAARIAALAQMIAVSGHRIEANLSYALSQYNNHGISEGMGLWTIGMLFPEFRSAARWRERGRHVLETQGRDLIYDDGSFAQHSVNYHRLMLHDYLWAMRLGEVQGQPLSAELKQRVCQAGTFLYHIQDAKSGRLPNYGQNDGALILPLSNCDYWDFRPVIQAIRYLTTGTHCYPAGPWNEELLWLFGPAALTAPLVPSTRLDIQANIGGYYTLRSSTGFVFTRCATFRHRPSQADMLHVDLWWHGQNVALDAGTYSYNAPQPWANPLAHTGYHNTVTVDGLDQMERVSRFLWLPWVRGRVLRTQRSSDHQLAYWEGEHDGYQRLRPSVRHRRGILRLGDDYWLVLDALQSSGEHRYRLHWLLSDLMYVWDEKAGHVELLTPVGVYHLQTGTMSRTGTYSLVRADAHSARGWRAPSYGSREPALSVALVVHARTIIFWTLFGPAVCRLSLQPAAFWIEADCWQVQVQFQTGTKGPLISCISAVGAFGSRLELM
jgi:asparagine synthase (glutamine-hydrolysing)